MEDKAIAIVTYESAAEIVRKRGHGAWVLNERRAIQQQYLVCCRPVMGTKYPDARFEAFLVGRMDRPTVVGTSRADQKRYRIPITEYALVELQVPWREWRNPVRYTSLKELELAPRNLNFQKVIDGLDQSARLSISDPVEVRKLTVNDAKKGLAAMLGVDPDQIEIEIRVRT